MISRPVHIPRRSILFIYLLHALVQDDSIPKALIKLQPGGLHRLPSSIDNTMELIVTDANVSLLAVLASLLLQLHSLQQEG